MQLYTQPAIVVHRFLQLIAVTLIKVTFNMDDGKSTRSSRSPPPATLGTPKPICYAAADGNKVVINLPINPWKVLGLAPKVSYAHVKTAFQNKITDPQRQNRALLSLANHMLTTTEPRYQELPGYLFTIKTPPDQFTVAAYGNTEELQVLLKRNKSLIHKSDEHGRTLLYLACKSGFYDMVKMLLKEGANIEKIQRDGSTPLHAAAFFGHPLVVGLLLQYGAQIDIKNTWGQTALQESSSADITNKIQNASSELMFSLKTNLAAKQLVSRMRPIEFKGQIIAKELIRDRRTLDQSTKSKLNAILKKWEMTWHGTRVGNVESILTNGLLPAGTGEIKPPPGHFELGRAFVGIKNWAAAIFVSPSMLYSAHEAYSERVMSNEEKWCVLFKVYCLPGSYKAYDPTVLSYEGMTDEPALPEYRVREEANKEIILRVESARNVVVRSLVFIRASILENKEINFKEVAEIFRE